MSAPELRRLVLALAHGLSDPRAMALAAEFARDFDLDLLGVYAEDDTLLRFASRDFFVPVCSARILDEVERNHELFANENRVVSSGRLETLSRECVLHPRRTRNREK